MERILTRSGSSSSSNCIIRITDSKLRQETLGKKNETATHGESGAGRDYAEVRSGLGIGGVI